jgi:TolB protein
LAAAAIDTIIEDSFKELKIKGFCSSSVAFCAQTSPGVRNIYICDIDGQNVRQLTRVKTLCVEPAWSPSGNTVLYSKYGKSGISVVETEVRPPHRSRMISSFPGINAGAALSPDGRKMAVILSPDHQVNLYVMDMGSRKKQRLTTGKAVEASPVWGPDGRQIAFVSDEGGSPKINVINADGTGRRVLKSIGRTTVTPDWSKDNKIVYAALVNGNYTLGVYDMNTGETSRVTKESGNWESPAWAADNRHVVAKRTAGGTSGIYVVDTWTGKVRPLLQTTHSLSMPAWSPCRPKKTL